MFFFGTGRLLLLGNCCLWGHPGPSGVGSPPGCHGCHLHPPSPARAPRGCLPMSRRDAGGLRVRGSSSAWEKNLRTGQERNMGNHGNVISNCQQLSATAPHVRLVNFLWKPMRQASPRDVCRFPPSVVIGQYYNWTYRTVLGASSHLVSGWNVAKPQLSLDKSDLTYTWGCYPLTKGWIYSRVTLVRKVDDTTDPGIQFPSYPSRRYNHWWLVICGTKGCKKNHVLPISMCCFLKGSRHVFGISPLSFASCYLTKCWVTFNPKYCGFIQCICDFNKLHSVHVYI